MTPIVELKEVVLEVEGKRYLDGVSCAFGQGETVVIGGAPGCGKSFFPRLLLGMPGVARGRPAPAVGRRPDRWDIGLFNGA